MRNSPAFHLDSASRRSFLHTSAGIGFGALIGDRATAADRREAVETWPGFGRAKSVIVVFVGGGQSQLEMWDPKPDAPLEVRGEFGSIETAVPGWRIGEHMPRIAKICDRLTVVKTMSHDDLDHGSAFYLAMSGRNHARKSSNPPPTPKDEPAFGASLKRYLRAKSAVRGVDRTSFIHPAIHINGPAQVPILIGPGQFGGYLGRDFDPMVIGDVTSGEKILPDLELPSGISRARLKSRQSLLQSIDAHSRAMERGQRMLDMNILYRQAFEMISRSETRNAFDLSAEPESVRDQYGRNRSGQACLLARRLAEAGIPLITVFWNHSNRGQDLSPDETDVYGWDTHNDIFHAMKQHLLPRFDLSYAALIEDLDARGMLDDTLVICMGEFGRAPLVKLEPNFAGSSPGRKHWAAVYSVTFAGAGVARGKVLGKSDRFAAYPDANKYGPWDITATIFSALGIDPESHFHDLTDRPIQLSSGRPIVGLYS
ncbi:MAG: DUF1501 domain-containing protein [Planctomycetota bacterium]|nr:DUF1501 domain-containing protein [Planctomycetota bacterium]